MTNDPAGMRARRRGQARAYGAYSGDEYAARCGRSAPTVSRGASGPIEQFTRHVVPPLSSAPRQPDPANAGLTAMIRNVASGAAVGTASARTGRRRRCQSDESHTARRVPDHGGDRAEMQRERAADAGRQGEQEAIRVVIGDAGEDRGSLIPRLHAHAAERIRRRGGYAPPFPGRGISAAPPGRPASRSRPPRHPGGDARGR